MDAEAEGNGGEEPTVDVEEEERVDEEAAEGDRDEPAVDVQDPVQLCSSQAVDAAAFEL